VAHKTASVVMAQAFGRDAFPVDTHIHRLAARWGLSNESSVDRTERDLKALFAPEDWGWLHLAIIYFGREHCPARGHDLASCPICGWAASKKRMAEEARAGGGGPGSRSKVRGTRKKKRAASAPAKAAAPSRKKAARKPLVKAAKGKQEKKGKKTAARRAGPKQGPRTTRSR
jgi:endonuclease-3